jgi:hypothetical protein
MHARHGDRTPADPDVVLNHEFGQPRAVAISTRLLQALRRYGSAPPRSRPSYKLAGFSVERLMTFLTALDRDVRIVIRQKPRSRRSARISMEAA